MSRAADALVIRRAVAEDAEAIRDLTRRAYAKWVAVIGREPLPMAADHAAAIRDHEVDLMIVDGRIIGVCEMIVEDDCVLLENLAIEPDRAGRGLGRRMLAHAEAVTRDRAKARLRLYTNAAFAENLRFYRANGYAIDREEPFRGGFTVHMSKAIEPV